MDNIRYTGNNEIPQNRKLFVKEQNKKIEELDKLYDKCMDLKFKNTGSKITIPINMFRRFTDIILLQKRSLVYEIGEKLEYDSLLTQNSELKQKVTENEISNIVDEEYIVDDSDEDILNKDIDLDTEDDTLESFTKVNKDGNSVDQYFKNTELSPFDDNKNSSLCQAEINSAYVLNGKWESSTFNFGKEDFGLLSDKKNNSVDMPVGNKQPIDNELNMNYYKLR
jgi:hypothetical protein